MPLPISRHGLFPCSPCLPLSFLCLLPCCSFPLPPSPILTNPPTQPAEALDGEKAQATSSPPASTSTPPQGRGVWLGEAGCTSMALQDSLSSSCGSLALSQGSLEHGPEDGALYDLLNDPAHSQRGRRAQKVDVSSLLEIGRASCRERVSSPV